MKTRNHVLTIVMLLTICNAGVLTDLPPTRTTYGP